MRPLVPDEALPPPPPPPRRWLRDGRGRIRSGWVVTVFTLVAVAVGSALHGAIWFFHLNAAYPMSLDDPLLGLETAANLISGVAATLVARAMGQEAGFERPKLLALGLVAAAVMLCLTVGIGAFASGAIAVSACSWRLLAGAQQLALIGPTALAEELWLRGAALRALARGTHPAFAVGGTGLVFGLLHLMNPDASAIAALNVALVGIWFGAMAWRAQSIWPAVGAHLAWNWFEGFVWGQNVSGIQAGCSLLTATTQPPFWGGGGFGPEASGFTALLLAVACAVTLAWPRRAPPPPATADTGSPPPALDRASP